MRVVIALAVCGVGVVRAGDDPESRARAALAFASTRLPAGCGVCRDDLDECRAESLRTGKPVVVFVGGCDVRGKLVTELGGIPVRTDRYDRDHDKQPERKRVVVLTPKAGELYITSLSAECSSDELRKAISPPRKVESVPVPVQLPFGTSNCPGGVCPTCPSSR